MAYYKKNNNYQSDGRTAEDKALDIFAEQMISKIQSISEDWKKPWFTEGTMRWPKNLSGREYGGNNALMLMLLCEKEGYKLPVFCTFDHVMSLNYEKDKQGERVKAVDKDGNDLPHVGVNKGQHSFPVFLYTWNCVNKETKERISFDDYKNLSNEDKKDYKLYSHTKVFSVFNVDQTNMREARPELYDKLLAENEVRKPELNGEEIYFAPLDKMIKDQSWICPIFLKHQDSAYYSISKNHIILPEPNQFVDGESFAGTCFHEQIHSTLVPEYCNRLKEGGTMDSSSYSKEELTAELGAALVAQRFGLSKHIKDDSAAYLKSWLESLKESPEYIKTVLYDVKKASSVLIEKIEKVQLELDNKMETNESNNHEQKPVYYASVNYLQMSDDTQLFDRMQEDGDYGRMIQEAAEFDNGDYINLEQTYKEAYHNPNDNVLAEDENYAVVYNNSVGGTYDIMRKVSEEEIRNVIRRYGLPSDVTNDVKDVAKTMVAEEFTNMVNQRAPVFEMDNGSILYVQYNKVEDTLDVGNVTNTGLNVEHSFKYDHDFSLDNNLQGIHERLSEMKEYQMEEQTESCVAEDSVEEEENETRTFRRGR